MSLKIVVLAKQVPDTRCVGKDAMPTVPLTARLFRLFSIRKT